MDDRLSLRYPLTYVTLTTVGDIDIFTNSFYLELLITNLEYCQQHKGLEIYAYLVTGNKLCLVSRCHTGGLNRVLGHFKSYTAKLILTHIEEDETESRKDWLLHMFRFHARFKSGYDEYHLWEENNNSVQLLTNKDFAGAMNAIHHIPVESGWVSEPAHWRFSSAHLPMLLTTNSL